MLQCRVAANGQAYNDLVDMGWRVKGVANGQATMVKGNYIKAERAKARRMVARQCQPVKPAEWTNARGIGPDRYPNW